MSENSFGAEHSQDDPIEGLAPLGDETPGDYEPTEQSGGESAETGTIYEPTGEPEATPHDIEITQAEEEDTL